MEARIALGVLKWKKTIAELASENGVHANQIISWKRQFLYAAPDAFTSVKDKDAKDKKIECDRLNQKVSRTC